jgi:hypothetical protein
MLCAGLNFGLLVAPSAPPSTPESRTSGNCRQVATGATSYRESRFAGTTTIMPSTRRGFPLVHRQSDIGLARRRFGRYAGAVFEAAAFAYTFPGLRYREVYPPGCTPVTRTSGCWAFFGRRILPFSVAAKSPSFGPSATHTKAECY